METAKLIRINGTVIKKSICDSLGIYKRHVKVKLFIPKIINEFETKKWNVWVDGFEMPHWWSIYDTKFVSADTIEDVTKNFCNNIKHNKVRKFVNNKAVILEVDKIVSKLNLEYKLELLN